MNHPSFKTHLQIFSNREQLGRKAADDIQRKINELLAVQPQVRMIFAAAPSQNEVLKHLVESTSIPWNKLVAFHMDEYIGLHNDAPQLFANFLTEKLFSRVQFKEVHLIDGKNTMDECERYGKLISAAPIDIVCLGIGENGHIAFNDPPVADFEDPELMKKVELDSVCRQQQVNDGCFQQFDEVPEYAYTLTIPALMSGRHLFCVVPGPSKKEAVHQTLNHPEISTEWPSTILRKHKSCTFYFDKDSYGS